MCSNKDIGGNAAALIVEAARNSGLLRAVAEALHYYRNDPRGEGAPSHYDGFEPQEEPRYYEGPRFVLENLTRDLAEHLPLSFSYADHRYLKFPSVDDLDLEPYLGIVTERIDA
jgi:hypothetical protein